MLALLLAPFGLVVSSLGNLLIHRLPQEEPPDRNVVTKASDCPACKARIKPWHNVPLMALGVLLTLPPLFRPEALTKIRTGPADLLQ